MKRVLLVFLLVALPLMAQEQPRQNNMRQMPMARARGGQGMMVMRGPGMNGKWWTNTELAKKLNLTDQQVQQMEQAYQQHRLKLIDQVAAVQKQEVMLEPMLSADRPDEAQVLAQIDKVAQARAELEKSHARMLLGIRQVLTADQWKQLKTEMPRGGMRRMGPGGPGGPGGRRGPGGPQAPQGPPPPQPQDQ
jgi:Spy/CpxP family protein refolding chaperone